MLTCDCGYTHQLELGERNLTSLLCPKCGRKIKRSETWIMPIGNLNMLEEKHFQGNEAEYLKKRRLKHGF